MKLRPDLSTAYIDPFYQQTTLFLFCDVLNPDTNQPYNRDPRSIAKKALKPIVKSSGVGDTAYLRPRGRVLRVRRRALVHRAENTGYSFDSTELPVNTAKEYAEGNMGHRPRSEGRLLPGQPGRLAPRTCAARCWR